MGQQAPPALLMGMQIAAAFPENTLEAILPAVLVAVTVTARTTAATANMGCSEVFYTHTSE